MKALLASVYGSAATLQFGEAEKPTPKAGEVLIKVRAAAINSADVHLLKGDPFLVKLRFGIFKPSFKILGNDVAGIVEAVGEGVQNLKPGMEVFGGNPNFRMGGFAEYVCVLENFLVIKPAELSFEEVAALPMAALTALQGLRDSGQIKPGQKVVIHGASGGVGTFAVQLAKYFGAEVTAVCSSRNVELVKSLGADHVIDYTKEDFTKNGQQYDLILGISGYHSLSDYRKVLKPEGRYVMVGGSNPQIFQGMFLIPLFSLLSKKKFLMLSQIESAKDLEFMQELLLQGKVKAVLDKSYNLSEGAEALRYVDEEHAKGKVLITMPS